MDADSNIEKLTMIIKCNKPFHLARTDHSLCHSAGWTRALPWG